MQNESEKSEVICYDWVTFILQELNMRSPISSRFYTLPELPLPCIYEGDASPMYDTPVGYTAKQMQAYGLECRLVALKEAAVILDSIKLY